jgi:hypothetical protein
MSIISQRIYRFNVISMKSKISTEKSAKDLILKHTWKCKVEEITLPEFRASNKTAVIKTVW